MRYEAKLICFKLLCKLNILAVVGKPLNELAHLCAIVFLIKKISNNMTQIHSR